MEDRLRHVEFKRPGREAVAHLSLGPAAPQWPLLDRSECLTSQGGDRAAPSLGALKVEGIRLRALEPCQSPAYGSRSPLECPQPPSRG